jgi:hypothetical protein
LRFDGKLSQKHKEKILKEFSESQDKLVCLSNFLLFSFPHRFIFS